MALAGDHLRVAVGGVELTGDSNKVSIKDERKLYDVTTFGNQVQRHIGGQYAVTLEHAGFLNSQAGRSHPILRGVVVEGVVSVFLGNNTVPIFGDSVFSMAVRQGKYQTLSEVAKAIPFNATFASRGERTGWGVALAAFQTLTNTTNGNGHDNGVTTNLGGVACLHVLQAPTPDTYALIVEGATNATFSTGVVTLASFTLNGSTLASERVSFTGSVPRYTRFRATRTGTAGNPLQIAISLIRF
jgi:hypothetical protein